MVICSYGFPVASRASKASGPASHEDRCVPNRPARCPWGLYSTWKFGRGGFRASWNSPTHFERMLPRPVRHGRGVTDGLLKERLFRDGWLSGRMRLRLTLLLLVKSCIYSGEMALPLGTLFIAYYKQDHILQNTFYYHFFTVAWLHTHNNVPSQNIDNIE